MLHALLHLHLVNVMSSSFPINTLLPVKKKKETDKEMRENILPLLNKNYTV